MKYLLPWKKCKGIFSGDHYYIRQVLGSQEFYQIFQIIGKEWVSNNPILMCKSKDAAMKIADKLLLEKGYEFVSLEREEKLLLLL